MFCFGVLNVISLILVRDLRNEDLLLCGLKTSLCCFIELPITLSAVSHVLSHYFAFRPSEAVFCPSLHVINLYIELQVWYSSVGIEMELSCQLHLPAVLRPM